MRRTSSVAHFIMAVFSILLALLAEEAAMAAS